MDAPALGNRGRVDLAVAQGLFEHFPSSELWLGDNKELVLVAAAGGGDIEAPVGGRGGDDGEADIDRVALAAVIPVDAGDPRRPGRRITPL